MSHWSMQPGPIVLIAALAFFYHGRTVTLAARGRPVAIGRRTCLYAGLTVGLLALVSPIDWLGENRLLWVHMIQHLLLGDIAPLLVVLGCPGAVLGPALAIRWLRPLRVLLHPLVALPLWIIDLCVWHLPAMYQAALAHPLIHELEHACFATAGTLMWAAVLEPLPGPVWFGNGWKTLYTLAVRATGLLLSMVFIWDGHVIYPAYVPRDALAHTGVLTDQRIAGLIMFTEGGVVTLIAFCWLFMRFARETEIRQRLIEKDLDASAAMRAARYDRSARAREVRP
jgi:cytochrome c oxidase assembly factor CtaG